jgi:hypothetical protein
VGHVTRSVQRRRIVAPRTIGVPAEWFAWHAQGLDVCHDLAANRAQINNSLLGLRRNRECQAQQCSRNEQKSTHDRSALRNISLRNRVRKPACVLGPRGWRRGRGVNKQVKCGGRRRGMQTPTQRRCGTNGGDSGDTLAARECWVRVHGQCSLQSVHGFNSRTFKLRKATSSPWSWRASGVAIFAPKPGTT